MYYIWKEWKENIRGKGLWLAMGIIALLSISMMYKSSVLAVDQGFYFLLLHLFDTLIYFIPVLCLFLGSFSIFQEKEQKTLIMLLTKRETFASFLWKKSVSIIVVFLNPVLIWFFIYLVPLKFLLILDVKSYLFFLTALCSVMIVFLMLGTFIGSISRSRMQIVGLTIFVWFYFFFLHDFMMLSFLEKVTYENVKLFSLFYFLNPFQAARIFLEGGIGVVSVGHMSKLLQNFLWANPAVFLLGNIVVWVMISYLLALIFHRKEGVE
ncbi:ABC transporter permease [Bacillus sp. CGMCC 1.16607]|uniref:ABC transporter permease n=1 Tax=Bacillus sp. CGMCC 1.16607 TaxID=3351842 RepID=UPI003637420A